MAHKILVIEDDKFIRELISKKLLKEGYDVVEAFDGEMGLESVRKEKPDLILLDLLLPGMDGFDVLARLKSDAEMKSISVIILSNLDQQEDIEKGVKMGAADYLIKAHFTPAEIVDKIRALLR